MRLKTNKTFIKDSKIKIKIKNQMNKNWSWNTNNKKGQTIIFEGEERKKSVHRWQIEPPLSTHVISQEKGHDDASINMVGECFWTRGGIHSWSKGRGYLSCAEKSAL
jgi:hypothetical protein